MTTDKRGWIEEWLLDDGVPPEEAKRDAETIRELAKRFRAQPLDTLRKMLRRDGT